MNTTPPQDLTNRGAVMVWVTEWLLYGAETCEPMPGVTLAVSEDGYLTTTTEYGTEHHSDVHALAEYAAHNAYSARDCTTSPDYSVEYAYRADYRSHIN